MTEKKDKIEDFNVFKNLGLNENQHSNLLKKLLHPNGKHGQNTLFLQSFLEMIDFPFNENAKWIVETNVVAGERGFIDLLIQNENQKIIIENKARGAVNQPHQLYRYWKNHIYNKSDYENFCIEIDGDLRNVQTNYEIYYQSSFIQKKYQIVYIVGSKHGIMYDNSKDIHPYYETEFPDLPKSLPMKPIELSFKEDISSWLESCLTKIELNENTSITSIQKLICVLEQYIEFLKKHI